VEIIMYPYQQGRRKVKDDFQALINQKLRELAIYPKNITNDLKNRVDRLREEELDLRRTNKFTKEKGYEMLNEIDTINDDLAKLPRPGVTNEEEEEEIEWRKKKSAKAKPKRKIIKKCKCK
jgi:hypothetical protein